MSHQPIADGALQAQAALASVATGAAAIAIDTPMYWLGVPMPVVLAAFAGSACALSFLGSLGRARAILVVACCTVIGFYLQPLIGSMFGIDKGVWPASAFATALLAHIVGTALFGAVPEAIKGMLAALIERIRGCS